MLEKVNKLLQKTNKHRKKKPSVKGLDKNTQHIIDYFEELDAMQRGIIKLQTKEMTDIARNFIGMESLVDELIEKQTDMVELSIFVANEIKLIKKGLKRRKLIWKHK